MSSLANAIKRKTHKERSQPAKRRKYGLLEKHKDYVLRAKDFHRKENTIKHLKRKAEERNPDEFYFAMENARTKNGVHVVNTAEANKYSQEELRLMKTQDVKYVSLKARVEAEKVGKLKNSQHFIGLAPQNTHTVFVDSAQDAKRFKADEFFDTAPELVGRAFNRPRKAQLQQQAANAPEPVAAAKAERRKLIAYKELLQRSERQHKLEHLAAKMAMDKEVMGKGRKRKLQTLPAQADEAAAGPRIKQFVWKRERKR